MDNPLKPLTGRTGILNEFLSKDQYPYLDNDMRAGMVVFEFLDQTFGCISPQGIAVSLEKNSYPFVELPIHAVTWDE